MSLEIWVRFLMSADSFCSILRGTERVSVLTPTLFICCTLYDFFNFFGFRQWRSRAERAVNLNTNIQCFGELELGPGPALTHMCGPGTWAALELTDSQVSGFVFRKYVFRKYRCLENTEKTKAP